jgi:hypothetical protein
MKKSEKRNAGRQQAEIVLQHAPEHADNDRPPVPQVNSSGEGHVMTGLHGAENAAASGRVPDLVCREPVECVVSADDI